MVRIFSDSEKQSIINEVTEKYPCNTQTQFNMYVEVIAGLRIINKILGNEWYQRATKEISTGDTPNEKKEHPIANYLSFKQPEKMVKLLNFANLLRNLYGKSTVEEKIQDYVRKEKRTTITTEKFNKVYTELKAANYFLDKGFRIQFLKERNDRKTPDFQVFAKDGSALVECKRKKEQKELLIESILDSARDANKQLKNSDIPGIIFIDIPLRPSEPRIIKKIEATSLGDVFAELETVHYILVSFEWSEKQYHATIPDLGRAYTKSYMVSYQNKMSDLKLSASLESVMRDITISPPRSLMAD